MIAAIMAGGIGSRMNLESEKKSEKLLLSFKEMPLVAHVVKAVSESGCFSKVIAVTSPNAPKTQEFLEKMNVDILESSGKGYVEDLNLLLNNIKNEPVMITSGDLPLLDGSIIQKIARHYDAAVPWVTVLVTAKFQNSIKQVSSYYVNFGGERCQYTGISVVNPSLIDGYLGSKIKEEYLVFDDKRVAFNVNTKADYDLLLGTS